MTDSIITTAATLWLDERDILHVRAKGVPSTAETVQESFDAMGQLLGDRRALFFFDARDWPFGSAGSWVAFINRVQEVCIAGAVLVDPAQPADLGPYPDLLSRLLVPLGVFDTEDDAYAFLDLHAD